MITSLLPFAVIGLCALPWLLLAARRCGAMLAGLAVLCGAPLLVFGVMLVTAALDLNPIAGVLVSAVALGLVGLALVVRGRAGLRAPSALTVARWAPAFIGATLWLVALSVAHALPGADALSWSMNGDSANNTHLGRAILRDNGIALPLGYPVPLPDALLALAMGLGRTSTTGGLLLQHDLTALGVTWALAIGATGLALGLTVSSLLSRGVFVTALASGVGSLFAATWFVTGLPIDSGYLNVHVALPFVLAAWLAFLQYRRHATASTLVLLASALLLLVTWTPLVVIPASLLAFVLWRDRDRFLRRPQRAEWIAIAGTAVVLGWLILVTLPGYVSRGSALNVPGHGYPSTLGILAVAGALAIAAAVVLRRRTHREIVSGVIALVAACALGIGALVFLSGMSEGASDSYYFAKLSWLLTVVLAAVALSLIVALLAMLRRQVLLVGGVLVVAIVLCTLGPSPARDIDIAQPVDRMLAGKVWSDGDDSVRVILEYTGRADAVVLWDSSYRDEAFINFWLFEYNGGAIDENPFVRSASILGYREYRDTGAYSPPSVEVLCQVIDGLNRPVTVLTTRTTLQAELEGECPAADVFVTQE